MNATWFLLSALVLNLFGVSLAQSDVRYRKDVTASLPAGSIFQIGLPVSVDETRGTVLLGERTVSGDYVVRPAEDVWPVGDGHVPEMYQEEALKGGFLKQECWGHLRGASKWSQDRPLGEVSLETVSRVEKGGVVYSRTASRLYSLETRHLPEAATAQNIEAAGEVARYRTVYSFKVRSEFLETISCTSRYIAIGDTWGVALRMDELPELLKGRPTPQ